MCKIKAPKHCHWVFANNHEYKPTGLPAPDRAEIAGKLLRRETAILNMVATHGRSVVVGIVLGKDTLHITLFDAEDYDTAAPNPVRTLAHSNDVLMMLSPNGFLSYIPRELRESALAGEILNRGARSLTAMEQSMLAINDAPTPSLQIHKLMA